MALLQNTISQRPSSEAIPPIQSKDPLPTHAESPKKVSKATAKKIYEALSQQKFITQETFNKTTLYTVSTPDTVEPDAIDSSIAWLTGGRTTRFFEGLKTRLGEKPKVFASKEAVLEHLREEYTNYQERSERSPSKQDNSDVNDPNQQSERGTCQEFPKAYTRKEGQPLFTSCDEIPGAAQELTCEFNGTTCRIKASEMSVVISEDGESIHTQKIYINFEDEKIEKKCEGRDKNLPKLDAFTSGQEKPLETLTLNFTADYLALSDNDACKDKQFKSEGQVTLTRNPKPVLVKQAPNVTLNIGDTYTIELDPLVKDDEPLKFTVDTEVNSKIVSDGAKHTLVFEPVSGDQGSHTIQVTATDKTSELYIEISLTVKNKAPIFLKEPQAVKVTTDGIKLSLKTIAQDPDKDPISCKLKISGTDNENMICSGDDISFSPTPEERGKKIVAELEVKDEFGGKVKSKPFEVIVENQAPENPSKPLKLNVTNGQENVYDLSQSFSDPENNPLSFQLFLAPNREPLPDWIKVESDKLICTPPDGLETQVELIGTVQDNFNGRSAVKPIQITVKNEESSSSTSASSSTASSATSRTESRTRTQTQTQTETQTSSSKTQTQSETKTKITPQKPTASETQEVDDSSTLTSPEAQEEITDTSRTPSNTQNTKELSTAELNEYLSTLPKTQTKKYVPKASAKPRLTTIPEDPDDELTKAQKEILTIPRETSDKTTESNRRILLITIFLPIALTGVFLVVIIYLVNELKRLSRPQLPDGQDPTWCCGLMGRSITIRLEPPVEDPAPLNRQDLPPYSPNVVQNPVFDITRPEHDPPTYTESEQDNRNVQRFEPQAINADAPGLVASIVQRFEEQAIGAEQEEVFGFLEDENIDS